MRIAHILQGMRTRGDALLRTRNRTRFGLRSNDERVVCARDKRIRTRPQEGKAMSTSPFERLTMDDLEAEAGAFLPSKEVLSVPLLDLNVDIDLFLALAAPIDLAVAGNLNVALPINAGVSANVLSALSTSAGVATQGVLIDQLISGEAIAEGIQSASIDQTFPEMGAAASDAPLAAAAVAPAGTADVAPGTDPVQPVTDAAAQVQPAAGAVTPVTDAVTATDAVTPVVDSVTPVVDSVTPVVDSVTPVVDSVTPVVDSVTPVVDSVVPVVDSVTPVVDSVQSTLDGALAGGLLHVDAKVTLDADLAAPIAGAVALNANIAAPVSAAVGANVGTIGSDAIAISDQTAIIVQHLNDVTAHAVADQTAEIDQ